MLPEGKLGCDPDTSRDDAKGTHTKIHMAWGWNESGRWPWCKGRVRDNRPRSPAQWSMMDSKDGRFKQVRLVTRSSEAVRPARQRGRDKATS
jgi:hypothetical protein